MSTTRDRPTLEGVLAYAGSTLDMDRLAELADRVGEGVRLTGRDPYDWEAGFRDRWPVIQALELERGAGRAILDLGAGQGYFARLATWLGHHVDALDAPGNTVGDDLCRWLGVHRITHRFNAGKVLPEFPHFFDLVVALDIGFNEKRGGILYGVEEWDFLLDDLKLNHLNHRGRLYLRFLDQSDKTGPGFGDPRLMTLFTRRGGRISEADRAVFFPHLI
jgi:SAM-dependent methyltransferase